MMEYAQVGVPRYPALQPILAVNPNPEGPQHQQQTHLEPQYGSDGHMLPRNHHHQQQQQQLSQQQTRPAVLKAAVTKQRYFVKLFVNGHYVDASGDALMGEDFVANFKDVFRWVQPVQGSSRPDGELGLAGWGVA